MDCRFWSALIIFSFFSSVSGAQVSNNSSIGIADDCTEVSVNFADDSSLTRQERIALMDAALISSLGKYERCALQQDQSQTNTAGASGGGMSGGGGGGDGANAGAEAQSASGGSEGDGNQGVESVASSTLSGTGNKDKPSEQSSADQGGPVSASGQGMNQVTGDTVADMSNGKIPEDIPSVDNDDVLGEQIRRAAMEETDPEIKEKLWDEYRKYKGLPTRGK